jgi:4-hydroxybenzoyl-CoA reductase subunit alpha
MHLGQALFEGILRDDKGKTLNPSFLDYKMATFMDIPKDQKLYAVGMPDPEGPFGAKEAGEGAGSPTIASITNAIRDAIGVRITSLPITPEKIVMAIKEKGK